jgi:DNA-binding Lrp family transcriptional regulator
MDELLKLLKTNARMTPGDLAKTLDMSEAAVRAKIARYEQDGTIRGYQAIVNDERLDIDDVQAVIEVKITPEREGGFNRISARIAKFPEVESLFLMSGTYDLLVFLKGPDLKKIAMFVSEKLATIDGVLSTATHFMLKTYKVNGVNMEKETQDERLQVSP